MPRFYYPQEIMDVEQQQEEVKGLELTPENVELVSKSGLS